MKLISCYIENYGKIKQKQFDFNGGVTSFCEGNGFGKSTLASFLKAMFYGLEPYRTTTKEFCDRQHFYPFEGGNFGGNVTFETDGKVYKIERFFGEKSDTQDTVAVFCNGVRTDEFGADIGKAVFGLDRQSFERTAFITSEDIEISSTTGINAKLNNFLEGADDGANLDAAVAILEKKSKQYKKSRKGDDLITNEKNEIEKLDYAITNAKNTAAALVEKNKTFARLGERITALEERVTKARNENIVLRDWEHYDYLTGQIVSAENEIKSIENMYTAGLPSEETIKLVKESIRKEGELRAELKQSSFTANDEAELSRLNVKFINGIPTEEEIVTVNDKIKKLFTLDTEINISVNKKFDDTVKKLKQKFSIYAPTDIEIEEVQKKVTGYKSAERKYADTPAYIGEVQTKLKPKTKYAAIVLAAGALIAVGGIALFFINLIAGIILTVGGGIALIAGGFLWLDKKNLSDSVIQRENPEKLKARREAEELSDAVKAFLLPYGYTSGNGIIYDFAQFKEDILQYRKLVIEEKEHKEILSQKTAEKAMIEKDLNEFFKNYSIVNGNYYDNISLLRSDIKSFKLLKERQKNSNVKAQEIEKSIAKYVAVFEGYCNMYCPGFTNAGASVEAAEKDKIKIKKLKEDIKTYQDRAEKQKSEKNLKYRPESGYIDIDGLEAELNRLRREQSNLHREICEDERTSEQLEYFENEKEQRVERLEDYKKKYGLLTATVAMLEQAERNLKEKYVKPVRDNFIRYSSLIESALGEKVVMNRDFEIRFERNGKERSDRHLSAGQRSICALCFRLALIGNMYSGEKPFLILDDPFVNLDGTHLIKVKKVLDGLSADMQIIYFSCHESRAL